MPKRLLRVLAGFTAVVLACLAAVVCVALFPPVDLLRRAALPVARGLLTHPNLHLGAIEIDPGLAGRIELRSIWLGAPAGFERPLLTVERIVLRYDASELLSHRRVVVRELRVERPLLWLERRRGKLNWQAFVDGLPRGGEEEPPSSPSRFSLTVRGAAVVGLGVRWLDPARQQRAVLDGLRLALSGKVVGARGSGRLELHLAPPRGASASVALAARSPERLRARLDTRLRLVAALERLQPLRGTLDLRLGVTSRQLKARWPIGALELAARVAAEIDQQRDRLQVKRIELDLDRKPLLRASAELTHLGGPQQLAVRVARLLLPLDRAAPLVRVFQPGLRFGGAVEAKNVELESPLAQLGPQLPPRLKGVVALRRLWADTRASGLPRLVARGLDGTLVFTAARPRPGAPPPAPRAMLAALPPRSAGGKRDAAASPTATVTAQLRLAALRGLGVDVAGLGIDVTAGVALQALRPTGAAARFALRLARASYRDRELGVWRGGLSLSGGAFVDLERQALGVRRLALSFADTLRLRGEALLRGWGRRGLEGRVRIAPLELARALALLPRRLRARLPLRRVRGRLALSLAARGRLPAPGTALWRLPLRGQAALELEGGSLELRQPQAKVSGVDLALEVAGRPPALRLKSRLKLAALSLPGEGLRVRGVALPVDARLRRDGVEGSFEVDVRRIQQRLPAQALTLDERRLSLKGRARVGVSLGRLLAGRPADLDPVQLELATRLRRARLRLPGVDLRLRRAALDATFSHRPHQGRPPRWQISGKLGHLREAVSGVTGRGARVRLSAALLRGLRLRAPVPVLTVADLAAEVDLSLSLARLAGKRIPLLDRRPSPLELRLAGELAPGGPLRLKGLTVALSRLGAHLALRGRLDHPLELLEPRRQPLLPAFSASLAAHVDNGRGTTFGGARPLVGGLRAAGMAGLKLDVARRGPRRLRVAGKVIARRLSLWLQTRRHEQLDAGGSREYRRTLRVKNVNAEVPFSQLLRVQLAPLHVAPPPPRRSIFSSSALRPGYYQLMRPFSGRRANLTVGGVTIFDELFTGGMDGQRSRSAHALRVGRAVLDLSVADSTVKLNQLYVKLFGGDVVAALQLQLPRLYPLDFRVRTDTRLTGVDLARLDPASRQRGETAKVSAMVRLDYQRSNRHVASRVLLTDISLKTLDSLLAYLDPHKLDKSVQANRKLLNAWYTRAAKPKVKKVAVWIDHSKINLDIALGAIWPVGAILRRALANTRIRRVSIKPFLPPMQKDRDDDPSTPRTRSARRRAGDWRVR